MRKNAVNSFQQVIHKLAVVAFCANEFDLSADISIIRYAVAVLKVTGISDFSGFASKKMKKDTQATPKKPGRPVVTLTTDFGLADPYVAALKGEILRYLPDANIVDISHEVPTYNILAGAFILANAAVEFPPGSIHVVIVDPEAHAHRNIIIAQFAGSTYIFPDNGVITLIKKLLPLENMIAVRDVSFLASMGASPIRERDYFAGLTAFVASGGDVNALGTMPQTYKILDIPQPRRDHGHITGNVIYVDRVGNLVTNIMSEAIIQRWGNQDNFAVSCKGQTVSQFSMEKFDPAPAGNSFAFINSMGLVEIEVTRGHACDYFQVSAGAPVSVYKDEQAHKKLAADRSEFKNHRKVIPSKKV